VKQRGLEASLRGATSGLRALCAAGARATFGGFMGKSAENSGRAEVSDEASAEARRRQA
jgi:hypothetical protein